jgi:hypothetical protein
MQEISSICRLLTTWWPMALFGAITTRNSYVLTLLKAIKKFS